MAGRGATRGGKAWLVAFSEIEGLRWVLSHSRMAFSPGTARRVGRIEPGDTLVLYVTRGAFHARPGTAQS